MPNVLNIQPTQEVEFRKGSTATNPIPPPGQPYDGRASGNLSALYPSTQQSTLITLTGSTAEGDVTTLTVTPILMSTGSAWGDNLGPITVTFTTGAAPNDTLDAVAKGLVQALTDSQTVSGLEDIANFQRISELIQWSSPGTAEILLVSQLAGATFSFAISSTGLVTDDGGVTTGTDDEPLYVGMAAAIDSYKNDGTPVLRPVQAGDTADQLVLVMDSIMCEPLEAGSPFRYYKRNKDVAWRHFGSASAWCGQAVTTVNSAVSVRLTTSTGGSEPLGELLVSDPGDGTTLVTWTGKTFLRTSTAGNCAIDIPHP
jgi:hypothetical protein